MKKTIDTIDLTKFIASILIFVMHCNVLEEKNIYIEVVTRWGVPFFFMCSGYFLFGKAIDGSIDKETLSHYIRRIISLYGVWLVVNIPNVFYYRLYMHSTSDFCFWIKFLKDFVLSSSFTGSWYLGSSIFSALIVYLLCKKNTTKRVLCITSSIYVLCALTSVYSGLLPLKVNQTLKFLCFPGNVLTGCIYFAAGKYI